MDRRSWRSAIGATSARTRRHGIVAAAAVALAFAVEPRPTLAQEAETASTAVADPSTTTLGPLLPTTTTTPVPTAPPRTLKQGLRGPDVLALEERLHLLRFDAGRVDGRFDAQTAQAVVAAQKLHGLKRSGVVGPETAGVVATMTIPGGLIPSAPLPRVEVDLGRQVMFVFDDYGLNRVLNISSGSEKAYCTTSPKSKQRVCGEAKTPRGNFRIQRRIAGWRESDLGKLYNPLYFDGGFAIHGSLSVPAYPASHGCIRISMTSAEWFPSVVANGTPVYLFD